MLKVFAFLSKREGMTTQEFREYYEQKHVPLVLGLARAPAVYKRNYLRRGDPFNLEDAAHVFDVVTELVFADQAALNEWMTTLSVQEVAEDEARFLERSRTSCYVIDECETVT
jgi:uncharacterized protein (TIGR02118 family)